MRTDRALLEVTKLAAGYGRTSVLRDIDLRVDEGEIVSLIGSNGAGKSTLLKAIVGLVPPSSGSVSLDGRDGDRPTTRETRDSRVSPWSPRVACCSVRFQSRDNLALGAYATSGSTRRSVTAERLEKVHDLFPVLAERADQSADTLSGGEQQMLAVGRALMSGPQAPAVGRAFTRTGTEGDR